MAESFYQRMIWNTRWIGSIGEQPEQCIHDESNHEESQRRRKETVINSVECGGDVEETEQHTY